MQRYIVYDCTESPAGGLADRIKGIISCFALANLLHREFIINWQYPFKLQSVLQPNTVDWLPKPIQGTAHQYFVIDQDNYEQFKQQFNAKTAANFFQEDISIIRTNINFLDHLEQEHMFKAYFEMLFKQPELPLDTAYNTIGLCARFGGQLSNWNDTDFNINLSFNDMLQKLLQTKQAHPSHKTFVCSDSKQFINFLNSKVDFLTTAGDTEHMDRPGCSMQGFVKSFHDFFLLRNCDIIISTKGGFAQTAALSSGKNVIKI